MTITFDFVHDFRKYREYISYVTKVDEVIGLLPFTFYQGDMLDCFVIQKDGDIVTVTMTNNTKDIETRFLKEAQPETFEGIADGVAFLYDLARHELIYNYDLKEPNTAWNWSTYPETFWMKEDERYDHGLMLGKDKQLYRMYLSNKRLLSLFVGVADINSSFPNLFAGGAKSVTVQPDGVNAVLSIMACQLGQDEPKLNDVRMAVSCDLIQPERDKYPEYNFQELIDLFENKGNEDDLWEDTWGSALKDTIARDDQRDGILGTGTSATATSTQNRMAMSKDYGFQLCLSEMADLTEVPDTLRPIYVHMDIPIHGVHYMMIEPDQTLAIFYDDLILKEEDILQHLENLPQDQIAMHADYVETNDAVSDQEEYEDFEDRFNKLNGGG